jgi:hypothetical protein
MMNERDHEPELEDDQRTLSDAIKAVARELVWRERSLIRGWIDAGLTEVSQRRLYGLT